MSDKAPALGLSAAKISPQPPAPLIFPSEMNAGNFTGSLNGSKFAYGTASLAANTGSPGSATLTIAFGMTFQSAPVVQVTVTSVSPAASFQYIQAFGDTVTTTNFRYLLFNWAAGVTETVGISWIAVGLA